MSKPLTFLQFTTGMDILVGKKIQVKFIKYKGLICMDFCAIEIIKLCLCLC